MVSNLKLMMSDGPTTVVSSVGKDRISGAETISGQKQSGIANDRLDRYFVKLGETATIAGSASRDPTPVRDAPDGKGHVTIELVDRSTITFRSVSDLSADNFIPTEQLHPAFG